MQGGGRAQLCSEHRESSPFAQPSLTGKAPPSMICLGLEQPGHGELGRATGKAKHGLVLQDEMLSLLCL